MFEIGPALRDARERRGLGLSQVEADTKIRARYIRALEDEDFGVLPGVTYTKGFLRAYAEYLGLDGQLFIDEFNSRHFDPRAEDESLYPQPRSRPRPRKARRESSVVMIALAAIVALVSIVFLAASNSGAPHAQLPTTLPSSVQPQVSTPQPSSTPSSPAPATSTKKHAKHAAPRGFTFTLTASAGDCWVEVLRAPAGTPVRSAAGTDLSTYTIPAGQSVTVRSARPLLVKLGAPHSVTATLGGRQVTLPEVAAGAQLRVTAKKIVAA